MVRFGLGLVRVIHPLPVALVVGSSVVLVAVLSREAQSALFLSRAAGVVLCSQIAVGALNDYLDRSFDAINQPEKPIPAGDFPAPAAVFLITLALCAMLPLALTFGVPAFALAILGTAAGLAYDVWLKPTPWSFLAYIVGFLTLLTWMLVITDRLSPWLLAAYPGGAMALTAGYLAQSLPDVETDAALGQRGLAALLGPRLTLRAVLVLCLPVAAATLVMSLVLSVYAASLLDVVGILLILAAWRRTRSRELLRPERKRLFRLLAPGIAALVLAGLITLARAA